MERPIINPQHACAARVTVLALCVCVSCCLVAVSLGSTRYMYNLIRHAQKCSAHPITLPKER